jgi:hypothetical protein
MGLPATKHQIAELRCLIRLRGAAAGSPPGRGSALPPHPRSACRWTPGGRLPLSDHDLGRSEPSLDRGAAVDLAEPSIDRWRAAECIAGVAPDRRHGEVHPHERPDVGDGVLFCQVRRLPKPTLQDVHQPDGLTDEAADGGGRSMVCGDEVQELAEGGPTPLIAQKSQDIACSRRLPDFGSSMPVFSARCKRIAPDSKTVLGPPMPSWSTIAGIFPLGETARNCGACWSPEPRFTRWTE